VAGQDGDAGTVDPTGRSVQVIRRDEDFGKILRGYLLVVVLSLAMWVLLVLAAIRVIHWLP
jgi:hypothetical protein